VISALAQLALLLAATGCPFCVATRPTFAERRDEADSVLLAELISSGNEAARYRLHQSLKGSLATASDGTFEILETTASPPHQLFVLLRSPDQKWASIAVDETSAAYFARSPATRLSEADRLAYFASFLEHDDAAIAEDAYGEFARASLDDVKRVANRVAPSKLRAWLASDAVVSDRKGLYGLMLGLTKDTAERNANVAALEAIIRSPESDFRAGFDGVLAGYLLLTGEQGLVTLEKRYIENAHARHGDVLHLLKALRFYQEYGSGITTARLAQAIKPLIRRPELAAAVITDLARWEAWDATHEIAALFDADEFGDGPTQRAIVGYLLVCPTPEARRALGVLREKHPRRVADLEATALMLGGGR
jgi:hypothetical protein